jgi:hypothetical protein
VNTEVIIKGERVEFGREVRLWTDTKLAFKDRPKRTETRAVWLHHTGGERPGEGLFDTLRQAGTSVNFAVDQRGVVWQYCDADVVTAHAGGPRVTYTANPWAIGIEFINRANAKAWNKTWPREIGDDLVCGDRIKATRLYPIQIETGVALVELLCGAYGLPMDVPRNEAGELNIERLTIEELRTFRGVGGHYHNHTVKLDPHTEILRAVAARGEALKRRTVA